MLMRLSDGAPDLRSGPGDVCEPDPMGAGRTSEGVPLIDRRAHQFQLGVAAALNLAAAATQSAVPLYAGAALFAVATPGFPDRSPLIGLWDRFAARVSPPQMLIDARPARVMSGASIASFILPAVAHTAGLRRTAMTVAAVAGAGLAIEAAVGRCVTCESYRWLAEHGVVHPSPPLENACIVMPTTAAV